MFNDFDPNAILEVPRISGIVIINALFTWPAGYNKFLIDSYLQLSQPKILSLVNNTNGMRVLESLLVSSTISLKVKRSLLHNLTGHYGKLARDKFGSFLFDKAWKSADIIAKVPGHFVYCTNECTLNTHFLGENS
jgi:nucleolar protein 9